MENVNNSQREIWVDNVKVIACVLVVLGHFFQSMVKSEIIADTHIFEWFNQTIYYFHVPLFFICSGYLYQKLSRVCNLKSWINNIVKKALSLGVPYFVFSVITWLIKNVLSSQVNNEASGFADNIFLNPVPPYWFLYALFFIFIVTPTFSSVKRARIGLVVALILRILLIIGRGHFIFIPYGVLRIMEYEIWFVAGMYICLTEFKKVVDESKSALLFSILLWMLFIFFSVLCYVNGITVEIIGLILGSVACLSIIILIIKMYGDNRQGSIFGFWAKYTMPIFLMHTIFAAGIRIILFIIGVKGSVIHIALGLVISFLGPVAAAIVMNKTRVLEFLLYPAKFVKLKGI